MIPANIQQTIREHFTAANNQPLTITVTSFGFSRGMPPVADMVFDMRFLANPYWQPELRALTGQDQRIGTYIRQDTAYPGAFSRIGDLLLFLLPRFQAQGKSYVHIAFGCTGGKHRSVFFAEEIAATLRKSGFSLTLVHRDILS